ncbi:hypothetical protein L3Q65_18380 [Amycolatopsis sp. FU40]|uniref:hypothetical protein n=1 Tax=Amycolatopsis sp. FU40 TaxID=2914159 RepID=UPI001F1CFC36|nr:hypothetical protein [Amycolatopsis sp. FU40]UKD58605.1 hypothetical protein L3Q65_18380 [Amycolatopsis sp. FU40]
MNVFGVPADEVLKLSQQFVGCLKTARALFSVIAPGQDAGAKSKEDRRRAYLGLLSATNDLMTWHNFLGELALTMQRWEPFRWRHTTTAIKQTADVRKAMSAFLAALSEVRLVGNPGPRAAAERITAVMGELFGVLPTSKGGAARVHEIEHTREWMRELGDAQKHFILAARRDLGSAKTPRARWWQLWRPRTVEAWPGGWPVPAATLTAEDETGGRELPPGSQPRQLSAGPRAEASAP